MNLQKRSYTTDFLEPLREEIQKGLSFVHDYRQINSQIRQNINVIIEKRYTGESFEEKLGQASQEEMAIYMAGRFLDEKLNVAKYLLHPDWLAIQEECSRFRVHGAIVKYVKLYEPMLQKKSVSINIQKGSYNEVYANPQAFSVIPHTLLDNAAKYSPRDSKIEVDLSDYGKDVDFAVGSYGPRIRPEEQDRIFDPFYRGRAAERSTIEGAGYGLYISQMIAERHLGSVIRLEQDSRNFDKRGHWTVFSIRIPSRAVILG